MNSDTNSLLKNIIEVDDEPDWKLTVDSSRKGREIRGIILNAISKSILMKIIVHVPNLRRKYKWKLELYQSYHFCEYCSDRDRKIFRKSQGLMIHYSSIHPRTPSKDREISNRAIKRCLVCGVKFKKKSSDSIDCSFCHNLMESSNCESEFKKYWSTFWRTWYLFIFFS